MHPLLDLFESNVSGRAERVAVSDQTLTLRYPELRAVAAGLADQIADQTAAPRVGVMAPSSAACATAVLACWYAGKTPIPLNFLLKPEELRAVIRDAELDLVVTIDKLAGALEGAPLKTLLLSGQTLVPGQRPAPTAKADDLATVIYTSGTSGLPKGVELTFENIVRNALASVEHFDFTPDAVFLGVIPQFHSFGFTTLTVVPLTLGSTVVYLPRFTPATIVSTIRDKQATVFLGVASMFGPLAALKSAAPDDLASLEVVVSGGEPLPQRIAEAFETRYGKRVLEGYGMTETSPVVAANTHAAHRAGSVGKPIPGVEVSIVDEQGQAVAPGRDGELVVRGHCVMRGYRHQPEATAEVLAEGALRTGDLGRFDEDGYLYITGRAKDLIIVSGENVYPREIEGVLSDHPAVAACGVVGQPDASRGEVPAAFVTLLEGASATEEELRSFCRERLAGYKTPRQIRIVAELPRGATGKILKRELRQMLA